MLLIFLFDKYHQKASGLYVCVYKSFKNNRNTYNILSLCNRKHTCLTCMFCFIIFTKYSHLLECKTLDAPHLFLWLISFHTQVICKGIPHHILSTMNRCCDGLVFHYNFWIITSGLINVLKRSKNYNTDKRQGWPYCSIVPCQESLAIQNIGPI